MSERKLAHIEKIVDIQPIPGADNIVKATVLGWECVVKKNSVNVGDKVIYIEIDSIVPATDPYFAFMQERKYRVKTIRLRKQISQGLIVSLNDMKDQLNKYHVPGIGWDNLDEGQDVTKELGITKYLSPSEREAEYVNLVARKKHGLFTRFMTRFQWYRKLTKQRSKSFPEWISKTDEERIQNMPWVLTKHKNTPFYVSEKLDGCSATYWYKRTNLFYNEFGICSRSVRKFELDHSKWSEMARELDIKNKLKSCKKDIAIQGEIIGLGIQGNKYCLNKLAFYIFNVLDIKTKRYFSLDELIEFCYKYGFTMVPILDTNFTLPDTVLDLVTYSNGTSTLKQCPREGIVIRTLDQKISFKVISPEFLLKNE